MSNFFESPPTSPSPARRPPESRFVGLIAALLIGSALASAPAAAEDVVWVGEESELSHVLAYELGLRGISFGVAAAAPEPSTPATLRATLVVRIDVNALLAHVTDAEGSTVALSIAGLETSPRLTATVIASVIEETWFAAPASSPPAASPPPLSPAPYSAPAHEEPSSVARDEAPPAPTPEPEIAPYFAIRYSPFGYDGRSGGAIVPNTASLELGAQFMRTFRLGLEVVGPILLHDQEGTWEPGSPAFGAGLSLSLRVDYERLELRVGGGTSSIAREAAETGEPATRVQYGLIASMHALIGVRFSDSFALLGGVTIQGVFLERFDPFPAVNLTLGVEWF